MDYQPNQGDIIYLDFNPQAGHEQKGRRPALIISNGQYHQRTQMAIVCPITNSNRAFPLHIELSTDTETTGVIMCEQIRSIDYRVRCAAFKEKAPEDLVSQVLQIVGLFF